jgi:hypothetical protein
MAAIDGYEGIVVLGVPRSGTTLLRRLLNAHPDIACPPETNLLSAAARFLEEHRFAGGLSIGVAPGLSFSGYAEQQVLDRFRDFLFSFWREIAVQAGKRRWAEKTAVDVFHLDAIERLCGARCRYLCILRHPLDVVCSLKELSDKMEFHMPELFAYVSRNAAELTAFAEAWRDGTERMLRFHEQHPDWSLTLRYEDLVQDPVRELGRVFEFLEEPTAVDALLERAMSDSSSVGLGDWKTYATHVLSTASIGRRKQLSPWTLKELEPVVNATALKAGYDPIAVARTADPSRLRDLGQSLARLKMSMTVQKNEHD